MSRDDVTRPERTQRLLGDHVTESDLLRPVRTRGSIRLAPPSEERDEIRTRGAIQPNAPVPRREPVATIESLLGASRQTTGGMPLTILIHGWGSAASRDFVRVLHPQLYRDDALWLVPSAPDEARAAQLRFDNVATLDMSLQADQRIYTNLVCDIVFFPALESVEFSLARQWERRTSAVITDARSPRADVLIETLRKVRLVLYAWRGGGVIDILT